METDAVADFPGMQGGVNITYIRKKICVWTMPL